MIERDDQTHKEQDMFKKALFISIILALAASLAACSSVSVAGVSASLLSSSQSRLNSSSSQAVESKLAIGTLKLEGTDLAITATQANTLLPLWKAVRSLSNDSNTTATEMAALYAQIEESMTAEQLKAIQDVTWTQADVSSLQKSYAAQTVQNSQKTTTTTSSTSSSMQADGGPMPGGDMLGGDPMMGGIGVSSQSTSSTTQSSKTKVQSSTSSADALNVELAGNVVSMLNQIISA
jgi:hypothetical protein